MEEPQEVWLVECQVVMEGVALPGVYETQGVSLSPEGAEELARLIFDAIASTGRQRRVVTRQVTCFRPSDVHAGRPEKKRSSDE